MKKLYLIVAFDKWGQPFKSQMVKCDQLAVKMRMEDIATYDSWTSTVEAYEINPEGRPLRIGDAIHTIEHIA